MLSIEEITELVKRLSQRPEVRIAQLEERIRELEEQLDQEIRLYARCRERIAKAREILQEDGSWFGSREQFEDLIHRTLDALEGK